MASEESQNEQETDCERFTKVQRIILVGVITFIALMLVIWVGSALYYNVGLDESLSQGYILPLWGMCLLFAVTLAIYWWYRGTKKPQSKSCQVVTPENQVTQ